MTSALARHMLRVAAHRWPGDIATEMHQEWRAELHAIAGRSWWSSFRQLRFAFSLAVSPPGGEKQRIGIRERSKQMKPVMAMLGLGTLVGALALAPLFPVMAFNGDSTTAMVHLALALVLVAVLGGRVADRMSKTETGPLTSSWALPLVVGVGALPLLSVSTLVFDSGIFAEPWVILASVAVWVAAVVPLVNWVKGMAEAGSHRLARWGGVLGGLAIVQLVSIPLVSAMFWAFGSMNNTVVDALLWFPQSLEGGLVSARMGSAESFGAMSVTHVLVTFAMATVFIVWYLARPAASVKSTVAAT